MITTGKVILETSIMPSISTTVSIQSTSWITSPWQMRLSALTFALIMGNLSSYYRAPWFTKLILLFLLLFFFWYMLRYFFILYLRISYGARIILLTKIFAILIHS